MKPHATACLHCLQATTSGRTCSPSMPMGSTCGACPSLRAHFTTLAPTAVSWLQTRCRRRHGLPNPSPYSPRAAPSYCREPRQLISGAHVGIASRALLVQPPLYGPRASAAIRSLAAASQSIADACRNTPRMFPQDGYTMLRVRQNATKLAPPRAVTSLGLMQPTPYRGDARYLAMASGARL